MKKLEGLTYTPTWVSHMGYLSGCTRHLDIPATDSWIYGATGHAFAINLHRDSSRARSDDRRSRRVYCLSATQSDLPDTSPCTRFMDRKA